ncbi:DUF726 domain-containing protein [Halopseudomonas oceani]|uniref:DUF726 domain-containing protein n=2 Tax=Halopseudomonas oceani TaxID=1708783 RepID=A0A2P4ESJ9_9GAMM|nr:DUF726 domain-containing protein [Halopseudomonas oceani]
MGRVFVEQLESYLLKHHPQVEQVNLIGHSLGGRVLATALKEGAVGQYFKIGDVLLMAAAVEVSTSEAAAMLCCVSGRLINAYSKSDRVLLMNVGETCIGRNEVGLFENVHMHGFGHSDYWPKLREVMEASKFSALSWPAGGLVPPPEEDFSKSDCVLYQVLKKSESRLLDAAVKYLKTSAWASFNECEPDKALAFAREFQLVAGNCLINLVRGNGLRYSQVLEMLADHFGMTSNLYGCARVVEYEERLVSYFFRNYFSNGHPLASATASQMKRVSQITYLEAVDDLSKRLTLTSSFQPREPSSSLALPGVRLLLASNSKIGTLIEAHRKASRLVIDLKTAIKPGYSALIPAVAIIYYARLQVNEEAWM